MRIDKYHSVSKNLSFSIKQGNLVYTLFQITFLKDLRNRVFIQNHAVAFNDIPIMDNHHPYLFAKEFSCCVYLCDNLIRRQCVDR